MHRSRGFKGETFTHGIPLRTSVSLTLSRSPTLPDALKAMIPAHQRQSRNGYGRIGIMRSAFTRRGLLELAALLPAWRAAGQAPVGRVVAEPPADRDPVEQPTPESFRVYTEAPRLFLSTSRLRLLRRERERRSIRWEQFETLWQAGTQYPEFGWTAALRYQIAEEGAVGRQAVTWAANAAPDGKAPVSDGVLRQIAIVADWCAPLLSADDKAQIYPKLERAMAGPAGNLAAARTKTLAAIALSEAKPDSAVKALREVYEGFWLGTFLPGLRAAKLHVSSSDANAMLELMHAFRDNLNFDLRQTFGKWFRDYPLTHILAHYPEPFPAAENEYRIPVDPEMDKRGPDVTKATLSRAAELAMVALDSNAPETQLLQGFLMNDRFLMRGALGITYEMLWANPYQPGLSYYHVPLVAHDEVGGELYVRSSWEDDAQLLAFTGGQLQLFANGEMVKVDPGVEHVPIDVTEATVFFARGTTKFRVPDRKPVEQPRNPADADPDQPPDDLPQDDVFIIGLNAKRRYHVEVDGEGMLETASDVGGIVYLPGLPAGASVRFGLAPPV